MKLWYHSHGTTLFNVPSHYTAETRDNSHHITTSCCFTCKMAYTARCCSLKAQFIPVGIALACVADETKPRYSPSANQRPKACSVLPGFSIIGSYWLSYMAVLSYTVIGRVAWNHGYAGSYTT